MAVKKNTPDFYALGIEGGATQATFCLMNQHRKVFAKGTISKCLNVRLIDEEHILTVLKEIKERLPHCPHSVGFCVAGMLPKESKTKYQHLIRTVWPSVKNFFINLWSGLIAYSFMDEFPSMPNYVYKLGKNDLDKIVLI